MTSKDHHEWQERKLILFHSISKSRKIGEMTKKKTEEQSYPKTLSDF